MESLLDRKGFVGRIILEIGREFRPTPVTALRLGACSRSTPHVLRAVLVFFCSAGFGEIVLCGVLGATSITA